MSKKNERGSVYAPVPPSAAVPAETSEQEAERLARELAGAEIDTRFREGLAKGTITGDIVVLDEHGNIIGGHKGTSIFDL